MKEQQPGPGTEGERQASGEEIWLLGQPPLWRYLDFVRDRVVGRASAERAALADEWRQANDDYHELEESEAGIADQVECLDLDPALAPLAAEVMADPRYRRAFDTLPTHFGRVELDRLVVYQTQVTHHFIEALKSRLGPAPDPATLFHFCLPLGQPDASIQIRRAGSRRYVFWSDSMDFRFHEPVLLRPDQIRDYNTFGPIAGVVGLVVGFGSNFLDVIRDDNRLLLRERLSPSLRTARTGYHPCTVHHSDGHAAG